MKRTRLRRHERAFSCSENTTLAAFCKTRPDTGDLPAEGLEPTRSCDHWILSPARLPFRHAGVLEGAKEYELRAEAQTLPTKSSGCMLRGGPKISRKIIASRKPDVDLSIAAISRGLV